jgi:hypothetical protein
MGKDGMKSRWMEHKGKRVFLADYSNLGYASDAIYAEGQDVVRELTQEPDHAALVIIDVHNTSASLANSAVFKNILGQTSGFVRKRAIVGLSASTRYFVNTIIHLSGKGSLTPLDSLEAALDWIVEEE